MAKINQRKVHKMLPFKSFRIIYKNKVLEQMCFLADASSTRLSPIISEFWGDGSIRFDFLESQKSQISSSCDKPSCDLDLFRYTLLKRGGVPFHTFLVTENKVCISVVISTYCEVSPQISIKLFDFVTSLEG